VPVPPPPRPTLKSIKYVSEPALKVDAGHNVDNITVHRRLSLPRIRALVDDHSATLADMCVAMSLTCLSRHSCMCDAQLSRFSLIDVVLLFRRQWPRQVFDKPTLHQRW
jgi:hypothetical protein